jgi:hypothetical protein
MGERRIGRSHGQAVQIGDSIVTVKLKPGPSRGRRVTLVVVPAAGLPVILLDSKPPQAEDEVCK